MLGFFLLLTFEYYLELTGSSVSCCIKSVVFDISGTQWKRVTTVVGLIHCNHRNIVSERWLDPGHRLGCVRSFIDIAWTV